MSSSLLISTGVVIHARFFPLAFETLDGDRKDKSSSETCSAFTMAEAAVFLCHIPYLTSKPFKSNSDVFGLTSDLCSDVTSTLLLLTPFVAMQLSLLFLSISTSPIVPCPLLSPIVSIPCYFRLAF